MPSSMQCLAPLSTTPFRVSKKSFQKKFSKKEKKKFQKSFQIIFHQFSYFQDRGQRTEDRGQKTENRRQRTEDTEMTIGRRRTMHSLLSTATPPANAPETIQWHQFVSTHHWPGTSQKNRGFCVPVSGGFCPNTVWKRTTGRHGPNIRRIPGTTTCCARGFGGRPENT